MQIIKLNPGIIKIISNSFSAHISHDDPILQLPIVSESYKESMWSVTFTLNF